MMVENPEPGEVIASDNPNYCLWKDPQYDPSITWEFRYDVPLLDPEKLMYRKRGSTPWLEFPPFANPDPKIMEFFHGPEYISGSDNKKWVTVEGEIVGFLVKDDPEDLTTFVVNVKRWRAVEWLDDKWINMDEDSQIHRLLVRESMLDHEIITKRQEQDNDPQLPDQGASLGDSIRFNTNRDEVNFNLFGR